VVIVAIAVIDVEAIDVTETGTATGTETTLPGGLRVLSKRRRMPTSRVFVWSLAVVRNSRDVLRVC
jgi:hypothetical protein